MMQSLETSDCELAAKLRKQGRILEKTSLITLQILFIVSVVRALVALAAFTGSRTLASRNDGSGSEIASKQEVDLKASIKRLPVIMNDEGHRTRAERFSSIRGIFASTPSDNITVGTRALILAACLRPGDKGEHVRELQNYLHQPIFEGFGHDGDKGPMYSEAIDGVYGSRTRRGADDFLKTFKREPLEVIERGCLGQERTNIPEEGTLPMSKNEFDTYFSGHIEQSAFVGDCSVISSIHAFSLSPYFEIMVRSSVKRLPDGSWGVRLPLMNHGKDHAVTITLDELAWKFNDRYYGNITSYSPIVTPVDANVGFRVLEAAYMKDKFGAVDRVKARGSGTDFFERIGGDNFGVVHVSCYGTSCSAHCNETYVNLDQKKDPFEGFLKNFRREEVIAVVGTKAEGIESTLSPNHAYSVVDVDHNKRLITLANPWNTSVPLQITPEELTDNFDTLSSARIDNGRMLANIKATKRQNSL